ncbi:hypothetical protein BDV98DRAFT_595271 [Pterulicium gracile]|uniref:Nephrocystin 3-like N-terminal domain-containing protein n=1 Tax=Pterulicium gracile TaxID=1884261 RepID=A0A5C3QAZ2_9AGAR|nr:hypothetical protein BDV98DRAFT_595271 [Pterula gracilis]
MAISLDISTALWGKMNPSFPLTKFSPELADKLLLIPIYEQAALGTTVVLIIDGLDESADPAKLARGLATLLPQLPPNIRLILTSRPDHYILSNFGYQRIHEIAIELKTDQSYVDVHHYITTLFREEIGKMFSGQEEWINWPLVAQILTLAEQASGLFVWASTAVGFIVAWVRSMGMMHRDVIIEQINRLGRGLEDLGQLYYYILDTAVDLRILSHTEETKHLANIRTLLGFLVINVERPLDLESTEAFLSSNQHPLDIHRCLQLFRSVLIPGAGIILPQTVPQMHKTFYEFLISERAGRFQVDPPYARLQLFVRCMEILLDKSSWPSPQSKPKGG